MNTSILVVGSYEFYQALPKQIRQQTSFSVEIATSVDEASSWAQIRPPDILLVQASVHNSEKFCQWSKAQPSLTYSYCVLVEDRFEADLLNCTGEIEQTAAMLENIADAYVHFFWLKSNEAQQIVNNRLLLAHIQVGQRHCQKYKELIDKNNTLSTIALADPLTQLSNRRAMERDLPAQILESRTNTNPLSLLILDVDRFKIINDTYGHLVGDRVLQLLSYRLKHNLRSQDLLFRYGGEEFVIVLNNTDCQQALFIANRLRRLIEEQVFTLDSALNLNITISIGSACLQSLDDRGGITLLTRADRCLLSAKVAGRNCVMGCTEQLCEPKKLAIAR
ncbi:GGDEF domain-containing protein [Synechocystis sp. PCC 7509]|uniref:GGDEF domain-containing protein n=1 Tax=Synechocystis sp. PCC 7509 TaxID=927677 RepID=UPI0002AC10F8|nr:diguanylate cyclase [Synechocystis sp. PCC 7509]